MVMNQPHGGRLINRLLIGKERQEELEKAKSYPPVFIENSTILDLELIANGTYSPLTGFLNHDDYYSVLRRLELTSGLCWTIPITCCISQDVAKEIKTGEKISLADKKNRLLGIMEVRDKFQVDYELELQILYQPPRVNSAALESFKRRREVALAGDIWLLNRPESALKSIYRLDPAGSRAMFQKMSWNRILTFQAPNPICQTNDSVEKYALKIVDGLFFQPEIPENELTPNEMMQQLDNYHKIMQYYYPREKSILGYLPRASRYNSPREFVLQAIMKKNYGCTHYIVAEKEVKAEQNYSLMDVRRFFEEISMERLDITPVFVDETFYCRKCERIVTPQTCQHDRNSSELVRAENMDAMLPLNHLPPLEFCCDEIMSLLSNKVWRNIPDGIQNNNLGGFSELNPRLQQFITDND